MDQCEKMMIWTSMV